MKIKLCITKKEKEIIASAIRFWDDYCEEIEEYCGEDDYYSQLETILRNATVCDD